jgi:hypothetical protein
MFEFLLQETLSGVANLMRDPDHSLQMPGAHSHNLTHSFPPSNDQADRKRSHYVKRHANWEVSLEQKGSTRG